MIIGTVLFISNLDVNVTACSPMNVENANVETICYWPDSNARCQMMAMFDIPTNAPIMMQSKSLSNDNEYVIDKNGQKNDIHKLLIGRL